MLVYVVVYTDLKYSLRNEEIVYPYSEIKKVFSHRNTAEIFLDKIDTDYIDKYKIVEVEMEQ